MPVFTDKAVDSGVASALTVFLPDLTFPATAGIYLGLIFISNTCMKHILTILLLLPVFSFAQDTCQLKKETDPFTHETKISTGFVPFIFNGVKVNVSVDATPSQIDFFFWFTGDSKCFDDESTIILNYEGERLKANFRNTGSMNCEGAFHFSFRNTVTTPSNLKKIGERKISSFKITGSGNTVTELALNEDQRQQFRRMTACVLLQAKTLIK